MKLKKYKLGEKLEESRVVFNEKEHTYFLGKKQLSGITRLISKQIFNDKKYENVPKFILEQAREKGGLIHSEIERYYKFGENGFTAELQNFIDLQKERNFVVLKNEFTVDNGIDFATNIDLVLFDKNLILCDIKTTAKLDLLYLSWQLSLNAEFFEKQTGYKVDKLMAYWTRKNRFVEINRISKEEIEKMINCDRNFEIYSQLNEINQDIEIINKDKFIQLQAEIQSQKAQLDKLKEQENKMKTEIMEQMKSRSIKSYDMGKIKITYIEPTTRENLDSRLLKVEMPEIYDKYKREIETKENLRITIRS